MATQPIKHVYTEINKGKYKSVKHFELVEVLNGKPQLSKLLNLSKNQNCALSIPDYWLKARQDNKWSKCITGLFKTNIKNIYKGDVDKRKHLLLFKYNVECRELIVNYFKNYYTDDLNSVLTYIRE